jgi:hypothetical protein
MSFFEGLISALCAGEVNFSSSRPKANKYYGCYLTANTEKQG